jgi:tetratricopeptide (TPR) repeat protein
VEDIRAIQAVSGIALANLYFLSERYTDAGSLYRSTLEQGDLSLDRSLEARLGVARASYLVGETDAVMEECAAIFRELADNPAFQSGRQDIDPVFMNVPVALVRMYHESGDSLRAHEFAGLALGFYDRTAAGAGRPETALDARLGALQVCLAVEDWSGAVGRLEGILGDGTLEPDARPGLELLLAEILAFPMRQTGRATEILDRVVATAGGSGFDVAAAYDLAAIQAQQGNTVAAADLFRAIEQDKSAPAALASRAMFARARLLQEGGDWDEAYGLYRRVEQLYPHTTPALEAPLVMTRHFVATGETALALRTLERARDNYLSLLDRGSPFVGDRLVVQAALAESFLAAGEAAGVAELLGTGSLQWDDVSNAAGMLRSAEVYVTALGDTAQAALMLKKCVERFPETRYSRVAQRRLDELGSGAR